MHPTNWAKTIKMMNARSLVNSGIFPGALTMSPAFSVLLPLLFGTVVSSFLEGFN